METLIRRFACNFCLRFTPTETSLLQILKDKTVLIHCKCRMCHLEHEYHLTSENWEMIVKNPQGRFVVQFPKELN